MHDPRELNPLTVHVLELIEHRGLSESDRMALLYALNGYRSTATFHSPRHFLVEITEWAAQLPPTQLPPRLAEAALYFGKSTRTIGRWCERAGLGGWEGYLSYWAQALREDGEPA